MTIGRAGERWVFLKIRTFVYDRRPDHRSCRHPSRDRVGLVAFVPDKTTESPGLSEVMA
jgi:hypothetical protein